MFSKECAILSADDMNKIKVGAIAVSRYHQIQRFFHTDDSPNIPDHDFPVPGYLIIPSGYMRLISNSSQDSSIVDEEDMIQYRDHKLNDVCEVSLDTSAQVLATPNERTVSFFYQPQLFFLLQVQQQSQLLWKILSSRYKYILEVPREQQQV